MVFFMRFDFLLVENFVVFIKLLKSLEEIFWLRVLVILERGMILLLFLLILSKIGILLINFCLSSFVGLLVRNFLLIVIIGYL